MRKAIPVFLVSIFCSIGGLVYAACISQHAEDGPRGGALGAAVALAFMVLTRSYGIRLYDTAAELIRLRGAAQTQAQPGQAQPVAPVAQPPVNLVELSQRVDRLADAIKTDAEEQKTASQLLALATFVGTIITGFGDKLAAWLIQLRHVG